MIGRVRAHWQRWRAAGHDFFAKLAPTCAYCDGVLARNKWRRMRRRSRGVRLQGARYCQTECLELALLEVLGRARPVAHRAASAPHRIPLGLLLLSRQQLTAEQLRTALEAQRQAGRGVKQRKIGAWLQELGFATEQQVTAALARQWSCPVWRGGAETMNSGRFPLIYPAIPIPLLESFQMMPVGLVEVTGTLTIAFSEGIDYAVLYAIEQMLGYRTEACLVCPSTLRKSLQALARERGASDVVFDRMEDARECVQVIGSYSAKVKAEEIRVARCGDHLWIRLERLREEAVTLVLRTAEASSQFSVPSSQ
jgi:hypothetical protein